eukprot:597608-Pyramimonas_sp.AAC.1
MGQGSFNSRSTGGSLPLPATCAWHKRRTRKKRSHLISRAAAAPWSAPAPPARARGAPLPPPAPPAAPWCAPPAQRAPAPSAPPPPPARPPPPAADTM